MKTTNECRVDYVDHMGSDLTCVNSARVSFDKQHEEFQDKDKGLINYLAKHNHWTPFAHCMVTLRETVPIFVARQRYKHVVGFSYNEVSRRYVSDEPEFFIPDEWRAKAESKKQGSGDETITHLAEPTYTVEDEVNSICLECLDLYDDMLKANICEEQARMVLPQNMMTSYYVTGSLAAWARAYHLRIQDDAQKEIRDLAKKWNEIIQPLYPVSWEALT